MRRAALAILLAAAGCRTLLGIDGDPQVVGDAEKPDAPKLSCAGDEDCAGDNRVCALPEGACVQCTPTRTEHCPGAQPHCVDFACVQCRTDADCASELCLPDHTCAAPDTVAYVGSEGSVLGSCTKLMPCANCELAIGTHRPYIKFLGPSSGPCVFTEARAVALFGEGGGSILETTDGACIEIGAGAISMYNMFIGPCAAEGIAVSSMAGSVSVAQSRIRNAEGYGIRVQAGTLRIERSHINSNIGGGVRCTNGCTVDITNTFIHHNGGTLSDTGGVRLEARELNSRFEHNTVVHNVAGTVGAAGGVDCDTTLVLRNTIIAGNRLGSDMSDNTQIAGSCGKPSTIVRATTETLMFVNETAPPYDYRIRAASEAVDMASSSTVYVDNEGDPRPVGGASDVGADELATP